MCTVYPTHWGGVSNLLSEAGINLQEVISSPRRSDLDVTANL